MSARRYYITTATGKTFYLDQPYARDVDLLDIAHALSYINRFTGHTTIPYSVGQHSLLVSNLIARKGDEYPPRIVILGLMHDFEEAYLGDINDQLKMLLRTDPSTNRHLSLITNEIRKAIFTHFRLDAPQEDEKEIIVRYDHEALMIEAKHLLVDTSDWDNIHLYQNYENELELMSVLGMTPMQVRAEIMKKMRLT